MKRVKLPFKRLIDNAVTPLITFLLLVFIAFSGQAQQVSLCYPMGADYWTGTCTSSTKDQASLVKWTSTSVNPLLYGWFMFDVSAIPLTATIDSVKLVYFCNTAYGTMQTAITKLTLDPTNLSTSGSQIYAAIAAPSFTYVTGASTALIADQNLWKTYVLGSVSTNQANIDLKNSIAAGKFAVGVKSPTAGANISRWASGWAQTNYVPYLRVRYTAGTNNDAGIDSITSPRNLYCAGTYPIIVKLKNYGVLALTSAKINWAINSVSQTQYSWTGSLAPGSTTYVTLNPAYVFNGGNYVITASSTLPNNVADGSPNNDGKTFMMSILYKPVLTLNPVDKQANVGDTVVYTAVGTPIGVTYQWQVSTDGCVTFSNVVNNALYTNATAQNLKVKNVSLAMNGYMYRCLISTVCPPAAVTDTAELSIGPPIRVSFTPSFACPATTISVPLMVSNMSNISSIRLNINYSSAVMNTPTLANLNAALTGASLAGSTPGHLVFNWTGTAASIASGKICDFQFNFISGNSNLVFDTITYASTVNTGGCKFVGGGGIHLPANFINGTASNNNPSFLTGTSDPPFVETTDYGGSALFWAVVSGSPTLQWQYSVSPYTVWTDVPIDLSIYPYGAHNDTLWVINALPAMDNYKYRLKATACGNTIYSNSAIFHVKLTVKMTLDTTYACHGDTVIMNCKVRNLINVASISASFYYKMSALQFIGFIPVTYPAGVPAVVPNNVNNVVAPGVPATGYGAILVGWFYLNGMTLANESPFIKVKFKFLSDSARLKWDSWNIGACEISDPDGNVLNSVFNDGFILDKAPKVILNPVAQTIAAGDTATYVASGSGYGGITYQWQVSTDGGTTWTNISASAIYTGVTTNILKVRGPTQTPYNNYKYRCKISGYCTPVYTNAVLLTVTPPPVKFIIPTIYTCLGDTVFVNLNTQDFTSISGFNLKLSYANASLTYISYKNKHAVINTGTLTVGNAVPGYVTISWAGTAGTLASGTLLTLKFTTTTLLSLSPVPFIPQASPVTYVPSNALVPKYTNGSVSTSSLPSPHNVVTPSPANGHFCTGGSGVQIGLDNTNLGINYGLYLNGVVIPAESSVPGTGMPMFFEGLYNTNNGIYTIIATDAISGCTRSMDGQVMVVADVAPTALTVTGGGSYCIGGTGVSVGVGGATDVNVRYILYRNGVPADSLMGIGSALNFGVQTITGTYAVKGKNALGGTCLADMSNTVAVTVNTPPNITNTPGNQSVCHNTSTTAVNFAADIAGTTYSWTYTPAVPSIGISSPGTGNIAGFNALNATGTAIVATFTVTPTANTCPGPVKTFTITVNPLPTVSITAISPNTVCKDAVPFAFTVTPTGGTFTGSTGINNPSAGMFNPALATAGLQTVNYNYTNPVSLCQNSNSKTFTVIVQPKITGTVRYKNSVQTLMGNVLINRVTYPGLVAVDNTTSSIVDGSYGFKCSASGNYKLNPSTVRVWTGGINASDALQVQRYTVGQIKLSPVTKKAADVNLSNTISTADALLIARRVVGLSTSFPAGDWVFVTDTVALQATDAIRTIYGIKIGDVDSSYIPNIALKTEPGLRLETSGELKVEELKTFEIPLYPEMPLRLGAMTIVLDYPSEYLEVMDIKSTLENFIYNIDRGEIRIAWFSANPVNFDRDHPLFLIQGRIKGGASATADLQLEANIECEINAADGRILSPPTLHYPRIELKTASPSFMVPDEHNFYLGNNFPNPFSKITEIPYYLPETSRVKITLMNLVGEEIAVIYDGNQSQGIYNLSFDGSKLSAGMYVYRMTASGNNGSFDQSRMLIINR